MPRFLRLPVFGSFLREYSLYLPVFSFLIILMSGRYYVRVQVDRCEAPFISLRGQYLARRAYQNSSSQPSMAMA